MSEHQNGIGQRSIGPWGAISIGIGGMVGGGIFAVLGEAVSLAHGATAIAFLFAGIVAILTSYAYAKLSVYFQNRGGTGNVFKTFSGTTSPSKAIGIINNLSTAEVLRMLKNNHPHEETRNYIVKVLDARKQFVSL